MMIGNHEPVAELAGHVSAYLGRRVPATEYLSVSLKDVLNRAQEDRADAEAYRALLADTRHLVRIDRSVGWTIQHPGKERVEGRLWGCEVHQAVRDLDVVEDLSEIPADGTYYCRVEAGRLVIEEPVG